MLQTARTGNVCCLAPTLTLFIIVLLLVTAARSGVSNITSRGQNRPGKDSNLACWKALENVGRKTLFLDF